MTMKISTRKNRNWTKKERLRVRSLTKRPLKLKWTSMWPVWRTKRKRRRGRRRLKITHHQSQRRKRCLRSSLTLYSPSWEYRPTRIPLRPLKLIDSICTQVEPMLLGPPLELSTWCQEILMPYLSDHVSKAWNTLQNCFLLVADISSTLSVTFCWSRENKFWGTFWSILRENYLTSLYTTSNITLWLTFSSNSCKSMWSSSHLKWSLRTAPSTRMTMTRRASKVAENLITRTRKMTTSLRRTRNWWSRSLSPRNKWLCKSWSRSYLIETTRILRLVSTPRLSSLTW